MDLNGGILNLQGVEILRQIETGGKKWYRQSLLPCSADIKQVGLMIHRFANTEYPYKIGRMPGFKGEAIKFSVERTIELAIKACGLEAEAERSSITISHAVDASNLSKNITHFTAGCVLGHRGALDPITRRPMISYGMQSRNNVFVYQSVLERETKAASEELFYPVWQDFEDCCKRKLPQK